MTNGDKTDDPFPNDRVRAARHPMPREWPSGTLANDSGRIEICWSVASDGAGTFRLAWSEQGGPPVVAPTRTGFGRTDLERMITGTLGGCATL